MAENVQENVQKVVENNNTNEQKENVKNTENFAGFETKFEEILNKRLDGVAKSVLKSHGMDEDEDIKNFIDSYHAKKAENNKKITDELETLRKENAELKEEKFKNELETSVKSLASKLGFDEKYAKQIIKLADFEDIKDKAGKIEEEKIEKAINAVLEDCEAFKVSKIIENKKNNNFTVIGAGYNEVNNSRDESKLSLAQKMKMHNNK